VSYGYRQEGPNTSECPRCGAVCWGMTSDALTGSSYMECKKCGHWLLLGRGYIADNGLLLNRPNVVGSWGTWSVRSEHVSRWTGA
jgi:ribosomal protein L32